MFKRGKICMSNSFRNEIRHFRKRICLVAISVPGRWSNIFTNLSGFIVGDRFETFTFSARTMIHSPPSLGYVIREEAVRKKILRLKNRERERGEDGAGWMVSRQWFFDSTIELAGFFPLFFSICINATEQRRGESRLLLYK